MSFLDSGILNSSIFFFCIDMLKKEFCLFHFEMLFFGGESQMQLQNYEIRNKLGIS